VEIHLIGYAAMFRNHSLFEKRLLEACLLELPAPPVGPPAAANFSFLFKLPIDSMNKNVMLFSISKP
jgi:hypothetical protein